MVLITSTHGIEVMTRQTAVGWSRCPGPGQSPAGAWSLLLGKGRAIRFALHYLHRARKMKWGQSTLRELPLFALLSAGTAEQEPAEHGANGDKQPDVERKKTIGSISSRVPYPPKKNRASGRASLGPGHGLMGSWLCALAAAAAPFEAPGVHPPARCERKRRRKGRKLTVQQWRI